MHLRILDFTPWQLLLWRKSYLFNRLHAAFGLNQTFVELSVSVLKKITDVEYSALKLSRGLKVHYVK
jgi:hypothetical protein